VEKSAEYEEGNVVRHLLGREYGHLERGTSLTLHR